MKIGIIGNGVVGQATARAWLEHCEQVLCWDEMKERRTHDCEEVLCNADMTFICLPESAVEPFIRDISIDYNHRHLVIRSTVPVGTTRRLAETYKQNNLVHSPEFLTERCAHTDAQMPTRNIVGIPTYNDPNGKPASRAGGLLVWWYSKRFPGVPTYVMPSDTSEAIKLIQNSWFATKVSFFNEIKSFADRKGLNWNLLMEALLADGRIGDSHTRVPGPDGKTGFGGKCLPKDLQQMIECFHEIRMRPFILEAVRHRNYLDRPDLA